MNDLINRLRAYIAQREKIRDGGDTVTECNGEPLTLTDLREAADVLEATQAERKVVVAEALKYADKSGRLEAKVERLVEAVRAVVADMREWGEPAKGAHVERIQRRLDDALRDHDQEVGNG